VRGNPLGTGEAQAHVLGSAGISSDEGQVNIGLGCARQLALGLLAGLTQPLDGQLVACQINPLDTTNISDGSPSIHTLYV
jgi:hypothetical protein